ncbi:DoxX family protein [Specibacter cremeus]|uniref:DoxX family protein n=1 Tax=Specibacter cremeus TaxID=1629051 RepID=UPI000F78AC79|nr:DoxX family protein [Specibacter cremeus]
MILIRALARPMLASSFILSGVTQLRHAEDTARQLAPVLGRVSAALPVQASEQTLARALGGAQIGAGALLAAGKFSRLAAVVLSATAALNAYVEYRSAGTDTREAKAHRRSQLAKNIGLAGGALLAAVDTAGRPGLAWRAGHLVDAGMKAGKQAGKQGGKKAGKAGRVVREFAHDVTGN